MAEGMTRREFAMGAAGLAMLGFGSEARGAAAKTLRLIASSDLRVLDPIWTTAGISRAHGYMVFDTPFALDAKFKPQPQMVGDYDISPNQLRYSFTLRDGLKFHTASRSTGPTASPHCDAGWYAMRLVSHWQPPSTRLSRPATRGSR